MFLPPAWLLSVVETLPPTPAFYVKQATRKVLYRALLR